MTVTNVSKKQSHVYVLQTCVLFHKNPEDNFCGILQVLIVCAAWFSQSYIKAQVAHTGTVFGPSVSVVGWWRRFSESAFPWTDLGNNVCKMWLALSRSGIEARQCEEQEIQIFFFLRASENSWLQSYTDCKTTALWPESLRDAFYVISFYSNRDERPFMLNFAIECSSWIEKCSCVGHLRLKA